MTENEVAVENKLARVSAEQANVFPVTLGVKVRIWLSLQLPGGVRMPPNFALVTVMGFPLKSTQVLVGLR